jgi:hypothetical protein
MNSIKSKVCSYEKIIKRYKFYFQALIGCIVQKSHITWDHDYWKKMWGIFDALNDEEFLRLFKPLYRTFYRRIPYLYLCAKIIVKYYKKCKILEPASGCNIFPDIMDSFRYQVIGLERRGSMPERYCRIKNIPIIAPIEWNSHWTDEKFDLIILICYFTKPEDVRLENSTVESLYSNIFPQIEEGAELIVFDERYIGLLKKKAEDLSLPFEIEIIYYPKSSWPFSRFNGHNFAIFSKKGSTRCFRKLLA